MICSHICCVLQNLGCLVESDSQRLSGCPQSPRPCIVPADVAMDAAKELLARLYSAVRSYKSCAKGDLAGKDAQHALIAECAGQFSAVLDDVGHLSTSDFVAIMRGKKGALETTRRVYELGEDRNRIKALMMADAMVKCISEARGRRGDGSAAAADGLDELQADVAVNFARSCVRLLAPYGTGRVTTADLQVNAASFLNHILSGLPLGGAHVAVSFSF